MPTAPAIVLFRRDLRLEDNPALHAAMARGAPVIPLFVLDDTDPLAPGGASRWWLHQSLKRLDAAMNKAGLALILRRGETGRIVHGLVEEVGADAVFWNRRYAAAHIAVDKQLKTDLGARGVETKSFNATLLREPWEIETRSGGFYKVFTPFWRALRAAGPSRSETLAFAPRKIARFENLRGEKLAAWRLVPTRPNWAEAFEQCWTPGEHGAHERLAAFLDNAAHDYAARRDRPDIEGTSRLSPHLAFGEISPLTIWRAVLARVESGDLAGGQAEKFLSELAWRDFSYTLLYQYPDIKTQAIREPFSSFPWDESETRLDAWRRGLTGYPIVDAGMRELWRTGWMHNRVRMIAASFLTKDLLIPWRQGEAWFWDTLVDADPANNPASWQWVAGCGADASPYFRIFNPVTQGRKFDPHGSYIRRYVPEISGLPDEFLHEPWRAPTGALADAGVALGETYPRPLVDHGEARKTALAAYDSLKGAV